MVTWGILYPQTVLRVVFMGSPWNFYNPFGDFSWYWSCFRIA